jgi:hypothetical protein
MAKLSYANVTATLALVMSMSGGALAANHYIINSSRQINPNVLKRLRGPKGPQGPGGPEGPAGPSALGGATGPMGPSGAPGTARVFGAVTAAGALTGPSKDVGWVSKVAEGKYCITPASSDVSPSNTLIVATVDASASNGGNAIARSSATNCPGRFEVDTIVYRELGGEILNEFRAEPFSFAIP